MSMTIEQQTTIERLIAAVQGLTVQPGFWGVEQIAAYFSKTPVYVRKYIITDPRFPKPVRLATARVWREKEVKAYGERLPKGQSK